MDGTGFSPGLARSVSGGRRGVSGRSRQNLFFLPLIFQVSVDELLSGAGKEKIVALLEAFVSQ